MEGGRGNERERKRERASERENERENERERERERNKDRGTARKRERIRETQPTHPFVFAVKYFSSSCFEVCPKNGARMRNQLDAKLLELPKPQARTLKFRNLKP